MRAACNINTDTPANLNATAYRIFKILTWLVERPLNVDELNSLMAADPAIGKTMSQDSLWLYINTLRALGCDIQRPGKRNGFRYTLMSHPFGLGSTQEDVDTLVNARQLAEQRFDWQELLAIDSLFAALLAPDKHLAEAYFAQSRVVDYSGKLHLIKIAEEAVEKNTLVLVTYQSPRHGKETFYLLPDESVGLVYRNGTLYLQGERYPVREELTLLRMDRVLDLAPVEKPEMTKSLRSHRNTLSEIVLRFYAAGPDAFDTPEPFGLGEETQWVAAQQEEDQKAEPAHLKMIVKTRDWFTLRQKILEAGVPVFVEKPDAFRESLLSTLDAMQQLYAGEDEREETHDSPHA